MSYDDRLERIAQRAVRPWFGPWRDDILQAARLACWQHRHLPDSWIILRARRAAIDEARRVLGRTGTLRQRQGRPTNLDDAPDPTIDDDHDPSVDLNLNARDSFIVDALARGWAKVDIATALGVTDSAISHHLRAMRRRLTAQDDR